MGRFSNRHLFYLASVLAIIFAMAMPDSAFARARQINGVIPAERYQQRPQSQQAFLPLQPPKQVSPQVSKEQQQPQPKSSLPQQETAFLASIETSLYGASSDQETSEARVARLEQTVFGEARPQMPLPDRLTLLHQTLAQTPAQNPPPQQQQAIQPTQQPSAAMTPLPDESDYPAVTALEQKVLGQTFAGQDITQRLGRLEMATFQSVQRGALADRVTNLQLLVFGNGNSQQQQQASAAPVQYGQNESYGPPAPVQSGPQYASRQIATSQNDITAATAQVEQQVFRHTYPADPLSARLDRLEMRMFHNTSPDMGPEDRLQRVIAVAAGGGDQAGPAPTTLKSKVSGLLPMLLPVAIMLLGLL